MYPAYHVRGPKRAPDMGKRAQGGTRTAFQPLQTLGSPGNMRNPSQTGRCMTQSEARSVDIVHTTVDATRFADSKRRTTSPTPHSCNYARNWTFGTLTRSWPYDLRRPGAAEGGHRLGKAARRLPQSRPCPRVRDQPGDRLPVMRHAKPECAAPLPPSSLCLAEAGVA